MLSLSLSSSCCMLGLKSKTENLISEIEHNIHIYITGTRTLLGLSGTKEFGYIGNLKAFDDE
jgi:hypothetical protein